jgi:hypothetical protein
MYGPQLYVWKTSALRSPMAGSRRLLSRFTNRPLPSLFYSHSSISDFVDVDFLFAGLQSISILPLTHAPAEWSGSATAKLELVLPCR